MKFPPRPILSEEDFEATQAQIDTLVDKREITQDERDYLEVLGILVCDYEQKHKPVEVRYRTVKSIDCRGKFAVIRFTLYF